MTTQQPPQWKYLANLGDSDPGSRTTAADSDEDTTARRDRIAERRALRRAYQFFRTHGNRADVALSLARAERWVWHEDLEYAWVEDEHFDPSDWDDPTAREFAHEHGAVGCILYRPCQPLRPCALMASGRGYECPHAEQLGSLWGIVESLDNRERDNYRRQVQAELALEAMGS